MTKSRSNTTDGRRNNGRKKGALNRRTKALRVMTEKALLSGMLPLEYMLRTLRSEEATHEQRMEAAICAAPYCHPKLIATDNVHRNAGLEFANKTGEQIRDQLVLWLIEKGVLIPGPHDAPPQPPRCSRPG
jgi:hypothetical protein